MVDALRDARVGPDGRPTPESLYGRRKLRTWGAPGKTPRTTRLDAHLLATAARPPGGEICRPEGTSPVLASAEQVLACFEAYGQMA